MCRPCPSQNGATPPWRGAGREQTAPYSAKRLGTLGGDNLPLHELRRNCWPIAVRLDLISFKHEPPYTFSHRLRHHHRTDQVAVSIQVRRQRRHASSWNANRTFSTTTRNHRRCTCGCWCDPRPSSRHHDASRRCRGSVGTPVGTAGRPSPSRALSPASALLVASESRSCFWISAQASSSSPCRSPLLSALLEMFSNPSGMFGKFRRVSCD
jgi:hypothetical protein